MLHILQHRMLKNGKVLKWHSVELVGGLWAWTQLAYRESGPGFHPATNRGQKTLPPLAMAEVMTAI